MFPSPKSVHGRSIYATYRVEAPRPFDVGELEESSNKVGPAVHLGSCMLYTSHDNRAACVTEIATRMSHAIGITRFDSYAVVISEIHRRRDNFNTETKRFSVLLCRQFRLTASKLTKISYCSFLIVNSSSV